MHNFPITEKTLSWHLTEYKYNWDALSHLTRSTVFLSSLQTSSPSVDKFSRYTRRLLPKQSLLLPPLFFTHCSCLYSSLFYLFFAFIFWFWFLHVSIFVSRPFKFINFNFCSILTAIRSFCWMMKQSTLHFVIFCVSDVSNSVVFWLAYYDHGFSVFFFKKKKINL